MDSLRFGGAVTIGYTRKRPFEVDTDRYTIKRITPTPDMDVNEPIIEVIANKDNLKPYGTQKPYARRQDRAFLKQVIQHKRANPDFSLYNVSLNDYARTPENNLHNLGMYHLRDAQSRSDLNTLTLPNTPLTRRLMMNLRQWARTAHPETLTPSDEQTPRPQQTRQLQNWMQHYGLMQTLDQKLQTLGLPVADISRRLMLNLLKASQPSQKPKR
jgi:hypothetical protein